MHTETAHTHTQSHSMQSPHQGREQAARVQSHTVDRSQPEHADTVSIGLRENASEDTHTAVPFIATMWSQPSELVRCGIHTHTMELYSVMKRTELCHW